jgi:hypothetical protein
MRRSRHGHYGVAFSANFYASLASPSGRSRDTDANGGDYRRLIANGWVLGTEFATGWSPQREEPTHHTPGNSRYRTRCAYAS